MSLTFANQGSFRKRAINYRALFYHIGIFLEDLHMSIGTRGICSKYNLQKVIISMNSIGVSEWGAVCCSVLQCVAVCCSVLQCVAV